METETQIVARDSGANIVSKYLLVSLPPTAGQTFTVRPKMTIFGT